LRKDTSLAASPSEDERLQIFSIGRTGGFSIELPAHPGKLLRDGVGCFYAELLKRLRCRVARCHQEAFVSQHVSAPD
jgi:hypothetical protein